MEGLNKQFNSDLIITNQIKTILNRFKIKTVVETGTYIGNTTKWFGENVKSVHSIEIDKNAYYTALRDNYHDNIK
jgi:16S rRNA A1518/A1519 N6-dimethyltransferase RsmA/KsgA/DIM1 with predicted DNA glycosylase/AP lyase activity